jgi:uncharacterized protein YndB with AHSA1/START domain
MTLGKLEQSTGSRPQLRFTRKLAHSPEKVWRAITEPEHLKAWFPDQIAGDFVVGATLRFSEAEGRLEPFEGKVSIVDPPRVLAFTWGTDSLRFELEPDGAHTILTLLDTFDELGKAARDGAGWHECLDYLEVELAGDTASWQPGERWAAVHPVYVSAFGPAASSIGPPS